MLCGQCVAGIVVAVSYILKEIQYVNISFNIQFNIHAIEI